MEADAIKELSFDRLKVRQIADCYLQVELNTEPLTQLVRHTPGTKKIPLSGKFPIDIKPFLSLMVQLTYLLYSCLLKETNVLVGKEMLVRPPRRGDPVPLQEVYVEYLLDRQFQRMTEGEQEAISRHFKFVQLTKSSSSFGQFVCDFISKIRTLIKGPVQKSKNSSEGYYRQMEGLNYIIQNFLHNQIRSLSPTSIIMSLEESEMFREYSSLLKCFNNSIFVSIRFFHSCKNVYDSLLAMETKYLQQMRNKRDLVEHAKKVENLLEDTFKLLLLNQVVLTEHSLEEIMGDLSNPKQYVIGDLKGNTLETRKYVATVYIKERTFRPFSQERLQDIIAHIEDLQFKEEEKVTDNKPGKMGGMKEKEKVLKNEYVVEYQAVKNMLSVKYITGIELNLENTDIMMFHCNHMSSNWNSISLQFVEKSSKAKKKGRYLAFKTISYLVEQEGIVLKIFTMIDLLTVYAKVVEPMLKRSIGNLEDYCLKNVQANQKCQHLRQLFIKKIEECYLGLSKNKA